MSRAPGVVADPWTSADLRAWCDRMRERRGWSRGECAAALRMHPHSLKNLLAGKRALRAAVRELAERVEREGPRRSRTAPAPPASGPAAAETSPTAAADEALLAAAEGYAVAVAALVEAAVAGAAGRGALLAEIGAAADRHNAAIDAGGYTPDAARRSSVLTRVAIAAMDALRIAGAARRAAAEAQTAAPGELVVFKRRGRGEGDRRGADAEVERQPDVVGALTASQGGSSHFFIAGEASVIGGPAGDGGAETVGDLAEMDGGLDLGGGAEDKERPAAGRPGRASRAKRRPTR